MSDYLRKYLYELKEKSDKQASLDKKRESDRKIEDEIQADKAVLTNELGKGIDWVSPESSLPSKTNSKHQPVNNSTIPDDTAHRRLKDLEKFISLLQHVATVEDIEINVMFLPINKQMLLDEIKKTKPKNGIWNITLSSFEQDWKLPFRKTVCGVVLSSKQIDPLFFRKLFNK